MLVLELLQQIRLALLITSHATRFLLSLVEHHLLHHGAGLAIQITQAGVLGGELGDVDLRCTLHHMRPPLLLVDLVKVDVDFFARRGWGRLEGPGGFVDDDGMREVTLQKTELV